MEDDQASVVTDTTRNSDSCQCHNTVISGFTVLWGFEGSDTTQDGHSSSAAPAAELSPIIPIQLSDQVCDMENKEDGRLESESEMSEPLIPLLRTSTDVRDTDSVKVKDVVENTYSLLSKCSDAHNPNSMTQTSDGLSQSLLPQIPDEHNSIPYTLAKNAHLLSLKNTKITSTQSINNVQSTTSPESDSASAAPNVHVHCTKRDQAFSSQSLESEPARVTSRISMNSQRETRGNIPECRRLDEMNKKRELLEEDYDFFQSMTKSDILVSTLLTSKTVMQEEEVDTALPAVKCHSSDTIIRRLDGLVSSLEQVPRKQVMVREAAILQCITKLQDIIYFTLKTASVDNQQTGIIPKLLKATQENLTMVYEFHRKEKRNENSLEVSCSSFQQPQINSSLQSFRNDIVKRQHQVFNLLKRQKKLLEMYKDLKRKMVVIKNVVVKPQIEDKADNTAYTRSKTGTNLEYIERNNDSIRILNSAQRQSSQTFTHSLEPTNSDVRTGQKSNYCTYNVMISNKETHDKVDRMTSDITIDKDIAEIEQSQDVTTIPDTQDFSTEDTIKININNQEEVQSKCDNLTVTIDVEQTDGYFRNEHVSNYSTDADVCTAMIGNDEIDKINDDSSVQLNYINICNIDQFTDFDLVYGDSCHETMTSKRSLEDQENTDNKKIKIIQKNDNSDDKTSKKEPCTKSDMLWLNMVRGQNEKESKPKQSCQTQQMCVDKTSEMLIAVKLNAPLKSTSNIEVVTAADNILRSSEYYNSVGDMSQLLISTSRPADHTIDNQLTYYSKDNNKLCAEKCTLVGQTNAKHHLGKNQMEYIIPKAIDLRNHDSLRVNHCPDESCHSVSPTATSMSSDVFLVKAKELERRRKTRALLCEITDKNRTEREKYVTAQETIIIESTTGNNTKDDHVHVVSGDNDKVDESINAVVEKSRKFAMEKKCFVNTVPWSTGGVPVRGTVPKSREIKPYLSHQQYSKFNGISEKVHATRNSTTKTLQNTPVVDSSDSNNRHTISPDPAYVLLSLKKLIHLKYLQPGQGVLSVILGCTTHVASVTPQAKIKTTDGCIFTTPSQWLSSLCNGALVTKSKAYQMVLYKGNPLMRYCKNGHSKNIQAPLNTPVSAVRIDAAFENIGNNHDQVVLVDEGVQVDLIPGTVAHIHDGKKALATLEDVKKLNKRLSTSLVRLLRQCDLVSNSDLPDNFWTEDFCKVRLCKDIWDCINLW